MLATYLIGLCHSNSMRMYVLLKNRGIQYELILQETNPYDQYS